MAFKRRDTEMEDNGWSVDFAPVSTPAPRQNSGNDQAPILPALKAERISQATYNYDHEDGYAYSQPRRGFNLKAFIVVIVAVFVLFISAGMFVTNVHNPKVLSFTGLNDLYFYRFISKHVETVRDINSEYATISKGDTLTIQRKIGEVKNKLKDEYVTVNKRKTTLTQTKTLLLDVIVLESKLYGLLEERINIVDKKDLDQNTADTKALMKQIDQKTKTLVKQTELLKKESV